MAEQNVITSMLDDLMQQQPISTALCIGQNLAEYQSKPTIQWTYFNVSGFLIQPFSQRYDLALVVLNTNESLALTSQHKSQLLVKLRDLMAKTIVVVATPADATLLRALGFTQLIEPLQANQDFVIWQFNILNYKQVPDWLNAKFWANPENWDKFRW